MNNPEIQQLTKEGFEITEGMYAGNPNYHIKWKNISLRINKATFSTEATKLYFRTIYNLDKRKTS